MGQTAARQKVQVNELQQMKKLPGRYKGTRRRREPPITAECPCGWRSRPMNPRKAEKRFAAHLAIRHAARPE
jgi:hypothetical protein